MSIRTATATVLAALATPAALVLTAGPTLAAPPDPSAVTVMAQPNEDPEGSLQPSPTEEPERGEDSARQGAPQPPTPNHQQQGAPNQ